MKEAPLSLKWPSCLDIVYSKPTGRWDPDRWIRAVHDERRPSSAAPVPPPVTNNKPDRPPDLELKRSRDPRERVKVYSIMIKFFSKIYYSQNTG